MAEWFKAAVLKTASPKGDVGSNPTPSAMHYVVHGKYFKSSKGKPWLRMMLRDSLNLLNKKRG